MSLYTTFARIILLVILSTLPIIGFSQNGSITKTENTTGGCGVNATGTLTLNGYTSVLRWEYADYTPGQTPFWDGLIFTTEKTINYNVASPTIFRAKISNTLYSQTVIVTMNALPPSLGGTITPVNTAACGNATGSLTLSGHTGAILRWEQNAGSGWINIGNGGAAVMNYVNITSTTSFRALIQNGTCPASYSATAVVSISSNPDGGILTGGGDFCNKALNVNLVLQAYSGSIVKWQSSSSEGTNWTDIQNTSSSLLISDLYQTRHYRAVVSANGCGTAYSSVAVVNVQPKPIAGTLSSSVGLTACKDDQVTISLTGNFGIPHYWVSDDGGTSWNVYSSAQLGTSFSLTLATAGAWIIKTHSYTPHCGINTLSVNQLQIQVTDLEKPDIRGPSLTSPELNSTYTIANFNPINSYTWSVSPGTIISGQGTPSTVLHIPNGTSTLGVVVSKLACSKTASIVVSSKINFIKEETINVAGQFTENDLVGLTNESKDVVTYFVDGLGRPIQTVEKQKSPLGKDVVSPKVYNRFGQEQYEYLPFVSIETSGLYKATAIRNGSVPQQTLFYQNGPADKVTDDDTPFSENMEEPSPLARIQKAYGPGSAWRTINDPKFTEYRYTVNVHGEGGLTEKVIAWKINANGLPERLSALPNYISDDGYWDTGQIYVRIAIDEDHREVREYTNKKGQVILKKVQAVDEPTLSIDSHWAQTYYIYDDFGNLVIVLPPEAVKALTSN